MGTFPKDPQLTLPFPNSEDTVIACDAGEAAYVNGSSRRRATVIPFGRVVRRPIKDWPRADRPRDKLFDHGPGTLTNAELLSIILRTGTRGRTALDQARKLLAQCDNDWKRLSMLGTGDLRRSGIGPVQAAEIHAVIEIAKRYGEREFKPGEPLRSAADVYAHFRERLAEERVEHFIAVLVDRSQSRRPVGSPSTRLPSSTSGAACGPAASIFVLRVSFTRSHMAWDRSRGLSEGDNGLLRLGASTSR